MFKKVFPLSSIIGLRFLSLFLVLPVVSAYALTLQGATDLLVGIVVGGYALTQAIFQVPFGVLSDKIGRKITILFGLSIAIAGSIICATSDDIMMLMIGRFLQGAGAVGSVITAMIGDLVAEEVRAKAMAIMGGTIGMSFALAMILGPVIGGGFANGVSILFWITAGLSLFSIILLFTKVPTPPKIVHTYAESIKTIHIFQDGALLRLFMANFLQKGMMIAAFVMIPKIMTIEFAWKMSELWMVYVPAIVLGLIMMGPAAVFGEKYNKPKQIFLIAIVLFALSFALMGMTTSIGLFITGVVFFFIAFNLMEPLLQSMITKFAKVHQKGAALGMGNTFGYLGSFLGGMTAGFYLADREMLGIIFVSISLVWLVWTLFMKNPTKTSHLYLPFDDIDLDKVKGLEHDALIEWYMNETEGLVIFKYKKELVEHDDFKSHVEKTAGSK